MRIKIIMGTLTGLVSFCLLSTAYADIPIARGWYVEGNVGATNTAVKNVDDDHNSDRGWGFNVDLGYKFLPFFGIEGGYTSYGTTTKDFTGIYAWDIAAKGILPFQEIGAELFAKLGPGFVQNNSEDDSNQTAFYYGLGATYYFTPHLGMLLQWTQLRGHDSLDLFSLGFNYIV